MLTVGERIKKVREEKNISQTELATLINISKQNLYKYENNIITNIPSDKIELIAKYLKISPCYIMGWDNNAETNTNQILLSNHEQTVIKAYRDKPEMQPAVDKLLGIDGYDNIVSLPKIARYTENSNYKSESKLNISKEKLENLRKIKPVTSEDDI